ncbi:hypothetical protein RVR77_001157 [Salmonella enterica]|nr:hypothetical protein [Salmonella enterica]EDX3117389.1 hypothetical protein [Salmonella enterica subsp. enterica serovar Mississippi]ELK4262927.1 hypothetical protein [Salmonella enterica]
MNETTKDTLNEIACVVQKRFEENNFIYKKQRFFERLDSNGNVALYEILLSKKKDYFSLHLRLTLKNKNLMGKVNNILKKVLNDVDYLYPDGWVAKTINESKKMVLSNDTIAMVTDWRIFKGDKSLEEFNRDFSIWMCVFNDLSEIKNAYNQLLKSVDYALDWFSLAGSDEWIINNSLYPSLYLLKIKGDEEKLNEKYNDVLSICRNKKEAELYFKHLNSM